MQVQSMKNEEKLINNIMFIYILGVGIAGWGFVMILLNGGIRDLKANLKMWFFLCHFFL